MTTTALAIIQPDELDTIQRTGRMLAASGYFDAKGESAQAIAMMATKILAGRELGFGPFASVNGIHIVQGKPTVGANLMAAAIKSSGRYNYKVRELTAKVCRLEFYEREGNTWVSAGISEYTIEEAPADLKAKPVWKAYPKNMLFARALSNGVRWYAPDIFSGNAVYVPEEMGADVDGEDNVIEATARRVDASTGEILEPADVDFGMGEQPAKPVLSKSQLQELNILGRQYYGAEWDTQRPKLVKHVSKGAITSSKELVPEEADKLINGLRKRVQEAEVAAQSEPTIHADEPVAEPELAF